MNIIRRLPRKLLYLIAGLAFIGINVASLIYTGHARQLGQFLGSVAILFLMFLSPYFYQRLPNGTGTLRGIEHGPKWQFEQYLARQRKWVRFLYTGINRLRAACLGAFAGGALAFCSMIIGVSVFTGLSGWLVAGIAWPAWWVLNGLGTLVLRAGSFPKALLIGKREFVIGWKAVAAGLSRIIIGVLMLSTPLNFIYLIYLWATGHLGDVLLRSFRPGW